MFVLLLAVPQAPSPGTILVAEQESLEPTGVPEPLHVHDQGPEPLTDEAVPVEHRLLDGALA